jgi:hypothetical protein
MRLWERTPVRRALEIAGLSTIASTSLYLVWRASRIVVSNPFSGG